MAAKENAEKSNLVKKHHEKSDFSYSRPKYREARWERAVKVYTINLESKYLLVQGVPAVGVTKELLEMFALYGAIQEYRILEDYPKEEFTEVYWIKFQKINAARYAKRKTDNRSFFGGILHVSYAPEFESVEDTREKLQERRRVIARKLKEIHGNQSSEVRREKQDSNKVSQTLTVKEQSVQYIPLPCTEPSSQTYAVSSEGTVTPSITTADIRPPQPCSTNSAAYPRLPPPPLTLHPTQYPPPPPPWELPRVPSANATLPLHLQRVPPPPPPPDTSDNHSATQGTRRNYSGSQISGELPRSSQFQPELTHYSNHYQPSDTSHLGRPPGQPGHQNQITNIPDHKAGFPGNRDLPQYPSNRPGHPPGPPPGQPPHQDQFTNVHGHNARSPGNRDLPRYPSNHPDHPPGPPPGQPPHQDQFSNIPDHNAGFPGNRDLSQYPSILPSHLPGPPPGQPPHQDQMTNIPDHNAGFSGNRYLPQYPSILPSHLPGPPPGQPTHQNQITNIPDHNAGFPGNRELPQYPSNLPGHIPGSPHQDQFSYIPGHNTGLPGNRYLPHFPAYLSGQTPGPPPGQPPHQNQPINFPDRVARFPGGRGQVMDFSMHSLQATEGSVERTVMSIRNKLKQVQKSKDGEPAIKKQRKRI